MRRLITLSILVSSLWGGVALADRHGGGHRGGNDRGNDRRGPVVRDHRAPVVVRQQERPRYRGVVRPNRRPIERRPIYVNSGQFRFNGGVTFRYQRPVIRQRYYDVRYRPQVVVETYPAQSGYIWVSGEWQWGGGEWQWVSGHYEADPQYTVYYDDGSWD